MACVTIEDGVDRLEAIFGQFLTEMAFLNHQARERYKTAEKRNRLAEERVERFEQEICEFKNEIRLPGGIASGTSGYEQAVGRAAGNSLPNLM